MNQQFNLLYPEWQGYGAHQEVFHGAQHFCRHVGRNMKYDSVDVLEEEELLKEGGIIGRHALVRMMDQAKGILLNANPSKVFLIGGTCSCEIVPVSFLNEKYDNDLAVFWFDAHGDLNTPESSLSGRLHGMPLRSLTGEGDSEVLRRISRFLKPEQIALVGTRDLDVGERQFIVEQKIPVFQPTSVSHLDELIDFAKYKGFKHAYIHFDLDVLEPDEFPHVLVPVPEGLRIQHAIEGMTKIRANFDVVGCSIVEYCPKDGGGTEEVGRLVKEGLGLEL